MDFDGQIRPACEATLRTEAGRPQRLIKSLLLSRPEHYLSIYQSGCNFSCQKCHSAEFAKQATGRWMTPDEVARAARLYESHVTVREPRDRATSWHAHDLCRGCGACLIHGERHPRCPGALRPDQLVLSPQGFGPARNIVAFTGGDIACRPEWYLETTRLIKASTECWVLLETNGFGLTDETLDALAQAGLDAFWLDIKAYDREVHRRLTGVDNPRLLELPEAILSRGFVLEVLSLHIPGWVEADQIGAIASRLAALDEELPFTVLAFFPAHKMGRERSPTASELVASYQAAREAGLKNVRVGNVGMTIKTQEDLETLEAGLAAEAW
jgi:pyruvate-formate lyase-activating enzyme